MCTQTDTFWRSMHTHTHWRGAHTHGHIHTCTHTDAHTDTQTHRHTPTYRHTHVRTQTHTGEACTHTYTDTHRDAHTDTQTHGDTHQHTDTHTRTLEHSKCALMSIQGQAEMAPGPLARADFVAGLAHFPINAQLGGKEPTILPSVGRPPPPLPPTHALLLRLRCPSLGGRKKRLPGGAPRAGQSSLRPAGGSGPSLQRRWRGVSACGSVLGRTYLSRAAGRKPFFQQNE